MKNKNTGIQATCSNAKVFSSSGAGISINSHYFGM
jgi:hypothetical protein